ncbi:hypothetical protein KQX54_002682 [Cotesia glomerata]|uniref:Uncharacterized protein n=1 Tax=Cotesia glomerata TaxID=32391 RepID=A0AAV7HWC4_COTGL|nr:hypothetical protein KQX54_002682 [Cotesia glomerata]
MLTNVLEKNELTIEKKSETLQPFITFVGSSDSPEAYYVVVDNVKYKVASALTALDVTYKIFISTNCQYPKSDRQVWLFIQSGTYIPPEEISVAVKEVFIPNKSTVMLMKKDITI